MVEYIYLDKCNNETYRLIYSHYQKKDNIVLVEVDGGRHCLYDENFCYWLHNLQLGSKVM